MLFARRLDETAVAGDMFRFWQRYLEAAALRKAAKEREVRDFGSSTLETVSEEAIQGITILVRDRVNPYVGQKYENWEWVTVP